MARRAVKQNVIVMDVAMVAVLSFCAFKVRMVDQELFLEKREFQKKLDRR